MVLHLTFAYATIPTKLEKLTFCSAYFYFGTAILKFDSFFLSYHFDVHESWRWQPLSLFLHYRNSYLPKSILPYTLFPTYFPQAYSPSEHSGQTDRKNGVVCPNTSFQCTLLFACLHLFWPCPYMSPYLHNRVMHILVLILEIKLIFYVTILLFNVTHVLSVHQF